MIEPATVKVFPPQIVGPVYLHMPSRKAFVKPALAIDKKSLLALDIQLFTLGSLEFP